MSKKTSRVKWSRQEVATLRRMTKTGNTAKEIGAELGRSPLAVATRKHMLGLKRKKNTYKNPTRKRRTVATNTSTTPNLQTPTGSTLIKGGAFTQNKLNVLFKAAKANNIPVTITFSF